MKTSPQSSSLHGALLSTENFFLAALSPRRHSQRSRSLPGAWCFSAVDIIIDSQPSFQSPRIGATFWPPSCLPIIEVYCSTRQLTQCFLSR
jgi:hypothetical protein